MTRLFRLSLILCIVLTGYALGSARGMTQIGDRVVLCSGEAVVVTYGPDGAPTESPHYCPDMATTLLAGVWTPPPQATPSETVLKVDYLAESSRGTPWRSVPVQARDPPFRILA